MPWLSKIELAAVVAPPEAELSDPILACRDRSVLLQGALRLGQLKGCQV
ncbi:MAG: hypothetical protein F6J93_27535 [Oscillatoria sp. SIO1A7]|nr:hypothetical protein [Oscillatoria sp. SIO1A7]